MSLVSVNRLRCLERFILICQGERAFSVSESLPCYDASLYLVAETHTANETIRVAEATYAF